jgi:cytochrome o ubiquinol oxidase subunit 1
LEWATSSPPPAYNFAVLPRVETIDAFWEIKKGKAIPVEPDYRAVEMPRNSPTGFITAFFMVVTGFALIWHIWWLVILGLLAAATTILVFGWSDDREREIPGSEIEQRERAQSDLGRSAWRPS